MDVQYYGDLGIIAMKGTEQLAETVDNYLKTWREADKKETYLMKHSCPRFGTGEGKGVINETCRGRDIFILTDLFNYGVTYKMYGMEVPMSPDNHYQDLKRIISAIGGKAERVSIIMPMLYEGRQHRRAARESLDCAEALQELSKLGVSNILTFDAHDARVQNAIPRSGFDNVRSAYQMLKGLNREYPDIKFDPNELMIISPDEGGMSRAMYYSSVLGLELGMFYKRRDYTRIVDGRNPIEAHEFLGHSVNGKDVIIVDDMISSGESAIDVAGELKKRGARRVFMFATFGLFCNGPEIFDKAYEEGIITRIFTSNLNYRTDELKSRPWYAEVRMGKYIAYLVDSINKEQSISELLDPVKRINNLVERVRNENTTN